MATVIQDHVGRELVVSSPPRRVVSLVPSDTYTLCRLGLAASVVGRTEYCVEPAAEVADIEVCGGTKNPDIDKIVALRPDLVICNKEENTRTIVVELVQRGIRVFVGFPTTVDEGISLVATFARIFSIADQPQVKVMMRAAYQVTREASQRSLRGFCPIWRDPLMTFRSGTYGHDALRWCGVDNVFASRDRKYPLQADLGKAVEWTADRSREHDLRYPRLDPAELIAQAPEVILLPDEPYEFAADDEDFFRSLAFDKPPTIVRCSGKDLFWHGAWAIAGLRRLREMIDGLTVGDR